jgi:hypothetical protein
MKCKQREKYQFMPSQRATIIMSTGMFGMRDVWFKDDRTDDGHTEKEER